jgi:hypothetical protein
MKAPSITFLAASSESPTMLTSFHSTSYLAIRSIHGRTQSGMIIQSGEEPKNSCVYIHIYIYVYTHNSYVYLTEIKTYQPVVMSQPVCISSVRTDFEPKVQAVIRRISLLQGL